MTQPARIFKVDYAVAAIEIVDKDAPTLPTPGHAPARLTSEGYLLAEALLARDGVLEYSDGKETWYEYRPRAELEAAAASWCMQPVTDKHPAKMVDATTWTKVARGVCASVPEIVDMQGIAYLHAKLLITDADLIKRVQARHDQGKPVQLSIGFTSVVIERAGEYVGTPYKFVQTEIIGNHEAVVDEGRAGPICRVLLDGKDVPMSAPEGVTFVVGLRVGIADEAYAAQTRADAGDPGLCYTHTEMANQPLTPSAKTAPVIAEYTMPITVTAGNVTRTKSDEAGAPSGLVEVPAPDGTPVSLPSWAAEIIAKARAAEGGAPMPAPAPMAPAPAPAPMANAMQGQPPAPAATPPAPEKPEDRKESLGDLIVARRKLERLAERVGVDASKLDEHDDDLKRAVIAKRMPHAKIDKLDSAALDAFVSAIADEPAEARKPAKPASPWRLDETPAANKPAAATRGDDINSKALAEYLATQGYGS